MDSKVQQPVGRVFEVCEAFYGHQIYQCHKMSLPRWCSSSPLPGDYLSYFKYNNKSSSRSSRSSKRNKSSNIYWSFACRTTKDKAIMRHSINFIYFISAPSTCRCPGKEVFRSLARSTLNQATNSRFDGRQHCCLIPMMLASGLVSPVHLLEVAFTPQIGF